MTSQTLMRQPAGAAVNFSASGAATFTIRTTPDGTRFHITNCIVSINGGNGGDTTISIQIDGVTIATLAYHMLVNTHENISFPLNSLHVGDGVEIIRASIGVPANAVVAVTLMGFDS